MSTITNPVVLATKKLSRYDSKKFVLEIKEQKQRVNDLRQSVENKEIKMEDVYKILDQLEDTLKEEHQENINKDDIRKVLKNSEQFLIQAQVTKMDLETRNCLKDIVLLLGKVKELAMNLDLDDRLQKIADENEKAVREINSMPGLEAHTRAATLEAICLVENWRPLFQLLISSREFKVMIVDFIKVIRKITLRYKNEQQSTEENHTNPFTTDPQPKISNDEFFDVLYEDIYNIMRTLALTPTYQDGLHRILHLFNIFKKQLSESIETGSESLLASAKTAQIESKELITSVIGSDPLDNFMSSLKIFYEKMNQENDTRQFLLELKKFIFDIKTDSVDRLSKNETKERLKKFTRDGTHLVDQFKFSNELHPFLDNAEKLVESIKNDEFVNVLRHYAGLVVHQDLSSKQDNHPLDREMLEKLKEVVSPMISEAFKSIPVHRIEENDTNRHFLMNNITLSGTNIKTADLTIQVETESFKNLGEVLPNQFHLFVTLKNFKTEVKDLDFYYHKKTIPQMIEQGKVAVNENSTLVLAYNMEQSVGKSPLFHQGKANFQIHNFEIQFEQPLTNEPLAPILNSIFKYQLQRQVETSVSRNLGSLVNGIGDKLTHALAQLTKQRIQNITENPSQSVEKDQHNDIQIKKTEHANEIPNQFEKENKFSV